MADDVEEARRERAKEMVKKAFGDDVDFTPGTSGDALVKIIEIELAEQERLRVLVESMMLDTSNDLDKLIR